MRSERHARVLAFRLGVADSPPLRLHTIGIELGVSRERVRQLEEMAMPRLVQALRTFDAGQQALRVTRDVIAPNHDGWEDRVIA
ncbi:MAG: hypothetical protein QOF60_218 [Actinomycetota bacterium]|jgi:DNA-directed RNA polymerase sigma subunit (sigma70/sigma32)|nr:hypothetical protein [Actinomycetota bacterium]